MLILLRRVDKIVLRRPRFPVAGTARELSHLPVRHSRKRHLARDWLARRSARFRRVRHLAIGRLADKVHRVPGIRNPELLPLAERRAVLVEALPGTSAGARPVFE